MALIRNRAIVSPVSEIVCNRAESVLNVRWSEQVLNTLPFPVKEQFHSKCYFYLPSVYFDVKSRKGWAAHKYRDSSLTIFFVANSIFSYKKSAFQADAGVFLYFSADLRLKYSYAGYL